MLLEARWEAAKVKLALWVLQLIYTNHHHIVRQSKREDRLEGIALSIFQGNDARRAAQLPNLGSRAVSAFAFAQYGFAMLYRPDSSVWELHYQG